MHRYKRIVFVLHISNLNQRKTTVLSRWGLPVLLFCKKYYSYTFNIYWWPLFYFVCQVTDYKQIYIYIWMYAYVCSLVLYNCMSAMYECMNACVTCVYEYICMWFAISSFSSCLYKGHVKDILILHMNLDLP